MKSQLTLCILLLVIALTGPASAQPLLFDFDTGVDAQWELPNTAGLWAIGTSGPNVSISKPADSLTEIPQGFIQGGIRSAFELTGDFEVTVDFSITELTVDPSAPLGLSESLISVTDDFGGQFVVLRFALSGSGQWIEAFSPSVGGIGAIAAPAEVLSGGRYRITRVGSTVSGSWATPGSSDFQAFGSATVSSEPMRISLLGIQGANGLGVNRSSNAVEIGFDNLIVVGATTVPIVASSWGQVKVGFGGQAR